MAFRGQSNIKPQTPVVVKKRDFPNRGPQSFAPQTSEAEALSRLSLEDRDPYDVRVPNFILARDFDLDKVIVGDVKEVANDYIVRPILYEYRMRKIERLMITVPMNQEEYILVQNAGKNVSSKYPDANKKAEFLFVLSKNKSSHNDIIRIIESVQEKCAESLSMEVTSNKIDDEKSYRLYAYPIESNNGVIYTKVYDDSRLINMDEAKGCLSRPGLSFSLVYTKNAKRAKLKISIYHMYVTRPEAQFPLATIESNE